MRKLMWFSVGFGAACAFGAYCFTGKLLLLLGFLCLAMGAALVLLRKKDWIRVVAVICLGLSAGLLWYDFYDTTYLKSVRQLDGQTVTLNLQVEDFSFPTEYGITVDGVATLAGRKCHLRVYLNQDGSLSPGDWVTGDFRLRYTAPGGSEDPTYHSGSGLLFLGYPKGEHGIIKSDKTQLRYMPAYLHRYLLELLEKILPQDTIAFGKALLLGDTSQLDYETNSDLSISGIRHVAAVSGLHVSILFSLIYLFSGKRRGLTVAIGLPVLLIFAAMAGFSASVVRAGIMQSLMLLALLFRKEYDPPTALAFAVLVMLAANPLTITSAGFQLSVASVSGIFLFSGKISGWLMDDKRLGRWKKKRVGKLLAKAAAAIAVSLSALITTTPLTVWYFGHVSLLSAVTNLLCLWVVTILFCGLMAACILGIIWLPLGQLFGLVLAWAVRYVLLIAKVVAHIPLAAVYTQSVYVVAWLVFCYVLLAVFLISKEKRPVIFSCCAVLTLCIALLASWIEPIFGTYRVTLLDVGQGQCVLLQSGGKTYMVDCGGDYEEDTADLAAAALLSQGIQKLDGLILTHYDEDHVGGAGYLLYRVPADVVILPEGKESEHWDDQLLKHHTGDVIRAEEDLSVSWNGSEITVYASWTTETSNESSLCVLFQTEKCAILITGDRSSLGEEILLRTASIPQLDALVIGHHGASGSTGEALLVATRPKTALISVGEGNAYGHPSQSVLDRLSQYGCVVRRTDLEGTVILKG